MALRRLLSRGKGSLELCQGFTLVEITLVLGLTLGLAAALIFGLSAYQQGADRAKCLLVQANVQKAVRVYQNLNELEIGVSCPGGGVIWPTSSGDGGTLLSAAPQCPSAKMAGANAYTVVGMEAMNTIPPLGEAYIRCTTVMDGTYKHTPKAVDGVGAR